MAHALAIMASLCTMSMSANVGNDHQWLSGDYRALPVLKQNQQETLKRLKNNELQEIDASLARTVSGVGELPSSRHYYLARAGYVGGPNPKGGLPGGLSLSVDVDQGGTAYVTSYRLTREHNMSDLAVVIVSQTRLKDMKSFCGAAE